MAPNVIIRQRDFSGGELVDYAKRRDDEALVRSGARQMKNWRIMATGALDNRSGRTALFSEDGRTDEVRMDEDSTYRLCFGRGTLRIRDSAGALVAAQGGFPWTRATRHLITWSLVGRDVVICFSEMKPVIARWDGASTWTFLAFAFDTGSDGIERVPFYRVATRGVTMTPSAVSGTVNIVFSDDVLVAGHIGSIIKWANKRLRVLTVVDAQNGTALCLETLLPVQRLTVTADDELGFQVGDVVAGSVTDSEGVVVEIDAASNYVYVQILNFKSGFTTSDALIGPYQRTAITAQAFSISPKATTVWDEQIISDAYGWPRSCSVDVSRLIFCDVPSVPEAIIESAISGYYDFDVTDASNSAIVELIAGRPRVYHVLGGSDQFIFTSRGVYYIPISEANPLRPGSVTFRRITSDKASTVRPVETAEGILFVSEGGTRIIGIIQTGQTAQPYVSRDEAEWSAHLFSSPLAITATTGDGQFAERYIYVLNDDGTVVIGRPNIGKKWIGWLPWVAGDLDDNDDDDTAGNAGDFEWVSALGGEALFTTKYTVDGTDIRLVELLDNDVYLDGVVPINAVPTPLQAATGAEFLSFPAAGTKVGDMTAVGGLAAAYDGTTSKAAAASASRAAASGFYGETLTVAQAVKKVEVWPSSDSGFAFNEAGNITVELKASNTAPDATGSNGIVLGTSTAADGTSMVTITSSDTTTEYLHRWVRIANASATNIYLAQAKFYHPGAVLAAAGGGTGDLWMYAGETVTLMNGLLILGNRAVDAAGDIVLEEGDDLSNVDIVAGLTWESVLEPFIPHVPEGQSVGQTMKKRQVTQAAVTVQQATGFQAGATEIPFYKQGENQELAPPQREDTYIFNVKGSDFDPRIEISKDTPGTLRVLELGFEISV